VGCNSAKDYRPRRVSYRCDARRGPREPETSWVIDVVDFNATAAGQRIIDDPPLAELIQVLSKYRLGLKDVEPDILGRAYEYLLRKFAEGWLGAAGSVVALVLMAGIIYTLYTNSLKREKP